MELRQRLLLSARLALAAMPFASHALLAAAATPAPVPAAAPALASGSDSRLAALRELAASGAAVTALVVDLESGQTIASIEPDRTLIPASLSKVFVAAAALRYWPPDQTFQTELASRARLAPTLNGDLVLRGGADSTLDEQTLWSLAAQLKGLGVQRVAGSLYVERAPFGEQDCDTVDRCTGQQRSARAFNAAPSAIGVNYGTWCLAVQPTAVGASARWRSCGASQLPIPVEGQIITADSTAMRVERGTSASGDSLRISGRIAAGAEQQLHRAMSDPAWGAGMLLKSELQQLGVSITGDVKVRADRDAKATAFAKIEGLQLSEQVARMMRYSNNYIADVLTLNLATATPTATPNATRVSLPNLAQASAQMANSLWQALGTRGTATMLPLLQSGSGLTTGSRVSAAQLVQVLRLMHADARRFPAFYGSLVVPRDAPFAYLRRGSEAWLDRVALKTGSLSEPVAVYGLAGYLRKRNGHLAAFALLVNGTERTSTLNTDRSLTAMRNDLTALLASL